MKHLIKRTPRTRNSFPQLFFDDFFTRGWDGYLNADRSAKNPAVNINEDDNQYRVELAVPGLKKEEIAVTLEGDTLVITATTQQEKGEENGQYNRKEFSQHSFTKRFQLPKGQVKTDKISAVHEHGILSVVLPKQVKQEAQPNKKTIKIK